MRPAKMILACLAVVSPCFLPTLVSAQWGVSPAPQSWNAPPPLGASPENGNQPRQQSQVLPRKTTTLDAAVTCAAALQLATMAAPNWGNERGITNSTNAWLQKVFALGEPHGISGDKVPGLVEAEMQRQIETAAQNPDTLSRRAFNCAAQQP
jgi:hypothetical protein